jgi:hypothetical protein
MEAVRYSETSVNLCRNKPCHIREYYSPVTHRFDNLKCYKWKPGSQWAENAIQKSWNGERHSGLPQITTSRPAVRGPSALTSYVVRFEVNVKAVAFLDATSCGLVDRYSTNVSEWLTASVFKVEIIFLTLSSGPVGHWTRRSRFMRTLVPVYQGIRCHIAEDRSVERKTIGTAAPPWT